MDIKKWVFRGFLTAVLGLYIWQSRVRHDYYFNKFIKLLPAVAEAKAQGSANQKELEERLKKYALRTRYIGREGWNGTSDEFYRKLDELGIFTVPGFDCVGKVLDVGADVFSLGSETTRFLKFTKMYGDCNRGYFVNNRVYINKDEINKCENKDACEIEVILHEAYHSLVYPRTGWKIDKKKDSSRVPLPEEGELGAYLFTLINAPNQETSDSAMKSIGCAIRGLENGIVKNSTVAMDILLRELFKRNLSYDDLLKMDYTKRSKIAIDIYTDLGYSKHIRDDVIYLFTQRNKIIPKLKK